MFTLLKLEQLRWTDHVTRMPHGRLPKKISLGYFWKESALKEAKRTLKASLKDFNIPTESWEQAAQDRKKWRCLINKGAATDSLEQKLA